jgi:hypothetical protein
MSLRGILRGFGLKVGPTTPNRFAGRIKELVSGHVTLEVVAAALLAAHAVLLREFASFERKVRTMARTDARVRLLIGTRRRRDRRAHLCVGNRRSDAIQIFEGGWRAFWADAEEAPIRRERHHRQDQQAR